jgi:hypothetical protein
MGKSSAPKAPSTSKAAKSSKKATKLATKQLKAQNALAKQQFGFFEDAYYENKEITDQIAAKELELLDQNSEWAEADRKRHESVFQPMEDDLVAEAFSYRSPERYDLEMGRAQADVAQKFDAQRKAAERNLEGYGINPAATRYAALDLGVRTQQAAATAAAGNVARDNVDQTGRALRSEAIAVGQKYPDWADKSADTAISAGNSAGANVNDATKTAALTMGSAQDWGALANNALGTTAQSASAEGNQKNAAYQNQLSAYNAEEANNLNWGEIGMAALGAGTKIASSYAGKPPVPTAATGGAIPGPGSAVPMQASPSGGQQVDDVNARLTPGEFVMPVDVVKWKGEEFFQKLIDQARGKKDGASAKPEMGAALPGPATFDSTPAR